MEFLPKALGTRPRLACEVRAEGVVAARAEDATAVLSAIARAPFDSGIAVPHIQIGQTTPDGTQREPLVRAIRAALNQVAQRGRNVTLVVPDTAVRVLLLDFDSLPAKGMDALPIIRFRLKKLVPFDADAAAVSYQVMTSRRDSTQVLAVAMPRELREEYEGLVREAGFEPGAMLPSTLAALAGLNQSERPTLLVNAARDSITTAIVRSGTLLLHRTVDLAATSSVPPEEPAALKGAEEALVDTSIAAIAARLATGMKQMPAESAPEAADDAVGPVLESVPANDATPKIDLGDEIVQAVSVAVAYFEDTLEVTPSVVMAAGTYGADMLTTALDEAQVGPVAVQEVVDRQMLGAVAETAGTSTGMPLGWLAGVRGALAN